MSRVRTIGLVGALVALVALAAAAPAHAAPGRTVYVGQCHGPSPYSTVQSAIDAAPDGGTVRVCPGTYGEQVRIEGRSGLTVRAAQGAVIDATSRIGTVVVVSSSSGVRLQGLTLRGSTTGVYAPGSPGLVLSGNQVDVGGDGVTLLDSPRSKVKDNVITLDRLTGVLVSRGNGTQVTGNTVSGGQIGLAVYDSSAVTAIGNDLDGRDQDAVDNTSGKGTAGTANRWRANACETSTPVGLCAAR